jgi:hypothetical protein
VAGWLEELGVVGERSTSTNSGCARVLKTSGVSDKSKGERLPISVLVLSRGVGVAEASLQRMIASGAGEVFC